MNSLALADKEFELELGELSNLEQISSPEHAEAVSKSSRIECLGTNSLALASSPDLLLDPISSSKTKLEPPRNSGS